MQQRTFYQSFQVSTMFFVVMCLSNRIKLGEVDLLKLLIAYILLEAECRHPHGGNRVENEDLTELRM